MEHRGAVTDRLARDLKELRSAKREALVAGLESLDRGAPRQRRTPGEDHGTDEQAERPASGRTEAFAQGQAFATAAPAGSSGSKHAVLSSDRNVSGCGSGVTLVKKPGIYKSYRKLVSNAQQGQDAQVRQLVERQGLGSSSDEDFLPDDPSVRGTPSSAPER